MPLPQSSHISSKTTVVHSVPTWLSQTQNWMYTQVRYLPDSVAPHIVCEHTENLKQFEMPHIHCLSEEPAWRRNVDRAMRKFGARKHLNYLVRQAKKQQAQVLHSHFGHYGWAEIEAARKANVKHVVTFYGLDVNFLPKQDPRWNASRYPDLFAHIDMILCEGSHMAKCIVDMGCSKDKVKVQHLGIRIDEIEYKPRQWQKDTPLRVLIAASFREKKGIPYALEALGRLQDQVPLEITIIGDAGQEARTQQEKKRILEIIEQHNFKNLRMLGYQPQTVLMEEAYNHHVFLSPSVTASNGDTEGGAPVSLIEMAASGMMIVSTTHCDIPEVVLDKEMGLLAPERDVDALVSHLTWLIENPEAWAPMLDRGRDHVLEQYDAKKQGQRLAAHYQDLVHA